MTYNQKKYKLTVNPEKRKVFGITLLGSRVIDRENDRPSLASCAGMHFNVFNRDGFTTGAELIEDYEYTIGDSFKETEIRLGKRKGGGNVQSRKTSSGASSSRGKATRE